MLDRWRSGLLGSRFGRVLLNLRAVLGGRDLLRERRRSDETIAADQKNLRRSRLVITSLIDRHYDGATVPPPELRTHIGPDDAEFGYWAKGINSSRWVLEIFGNEPDGPVLDWGCGSGRTFLWLRCHPEWRQHYRGCDADEGAVAWLRSQGHLQVLQSNPEGPLPYEDGSLSGLFAFSVLTHVQPGRHRQWYEEIGRVLSEGSHALITLQGRKFTASNVDDPPPWFEENGSAWIPDPTGNAFRDLALVTEEFTRRAIEGNLVCERYLEAAYGEQDVVLLRR